MTPTVNRDTRTEVAIILYYHIMGVNNKAVSKLIELKTGFNQHTPQKCRQRIDFTREKDFPQPRPWDKEEIGKEIPNLVDRDTFLHLTNIDAACESILAKVGPIHH